MDLLFPQLRMKGAGKSLDWKMIKFQTGQSLLRRATANFTPLITEGSIIELEAFAEAHGLPGKVTNGSGFRLVTNSY